ncbi:hypothetical protein [Sphingomonas sp. NIBR02145]|uniref:hypothetical protein n=1 Tax=Sphingomonas sp. NIBR02145 TaxID=3014784 RepID=UPI0022B38881|nr:hypothetical protein [Sphingomonas sp. NIBR02145]WHU00873.1 hypothetical protein O3305_11625 [Sphingomonas sp. NIBR02145]
MTAIRITAALLLVAQLVRWAWFLLGGVPLARALAHIEFNWDGGALAPLAVLVLTRFDRRGSWVQRLGIWLVLLSSACSLVVWVTRPDYVPNYPEIDDRVLIGAGAWLLGMLALAVGVALVSGDWLTRFMHRERGQAG